MKKNHKILIGFLVLFMVIAGTIIYLINSGRETKGMEEETESIVGIDDSETENSNIYKTEYNGISYSIEMPDNWTYKEIQDGLLVNFEMDGKTVATIEVNPEYEYSTSTSSILEVWLGMHAREKEKSVDTDFGIYTRKKLWVEWEPSAAQEIEGESFKDELHYFYFTNKNNADDTCFFVDLYILTDYVTEKEADKIADSMQIVIKNEE